MYRITLPENCSSNCYDSIVYSLLKYYNFDYEAYNLQYFYTNYYDGIDHCILRNKYQVHILKDIFDISVSITNKEESINILDIINILLNNNPIGIFVDPYYCYWSPFYKKSHYSHVLLIIDIDYNDMKYICFDVHYNSVGYIKVDFDVINNNYEQCFIFNFNEINNVNIELIIQNINEQLNNFDDNLDNKKEEMTNYFIGIREKLLSLENIETFIPLINIMWIAEDKKHSKILFEYIENKNKNFDFSLIYQLLTTSEQQFVRLKLMLIKYAKTGSIKDDSLKNIINKIFDTDELIINQLKNILGGSV